MFPLLKRQLVRGCAAHIRNGLSCAADYSAYFVSLYASHNGELYEPYWYLFGWGQGGKWLGIKRPNGDRIEFAHLSQYIRKSRPVIAGEKVAITGNTGTVTDFPHLHVQIYNKAGKRLDPELYVWDTPTGAIDVPGSFKRVWGRDGAAGELNVFTKRLKQGTIKGQADLDDKLEYWRGIVYPNGQYSKEGDARWAKEKTKYLPL